MIFKTITDESTGATKSIGLFGKTISEFKKSISVLKSKGIANTLFNTSTIDVNAVFKYNEEIKNAIDCGASFADKQQIMKSAMEGTNHVTAQLIKSTNGAVVSTETLANALKASTLSAKAGAVAMKALAIIGNMIVLQLSITIYTHSPLLFSYEGMKNKTQNHNICLFLLV